MFKLLKFKLIIINLCVISILFFLMSFAQFIMMDKSSERETIQFIHVLESNSAKGHSTPPATGEEAAIKYFFFRFDGNNQLIESSKRIPLGKKDVDKLIKQALAEHKQHNDMEFKNHKYYYYKNFKTASNRRTIFFVNYDDEYKVLEKMFMILIISGAGGILLALLASYFMAGNAIKPIRSSWERQRDFVADASHELRTPVSIIRTNLEVLKANGDEKVSTQMEWIDNALDESIRISKLISDLLFLARSDAHKLNTVTSSVDISEIALKAAASFKLTAANQHIAIKTEIEPSLFIEGDREILMQLLVILLDNALRHTPGSGQITIGAASKPGKIELWVSDTGDGIPKEAMEKIFERFYRIDNARSSETGGTGLGLAIAKAITESHNGQITVESTPEKGSKFIITLPKLK